MVYIEFSIENGRKIKIQNDKYSIEIILGYFRLNFTNPSPKNYNILPYVFNFLICLRKISIKNKSKLISIEYLEQ
jgi:hypothetical protein